jgi:hypothetical protein
MPTQKFKNITTPYYFTVYLNPILLS